MADNNPSTSDKGKDIVDIGSTDFSAESNFDSLKSSVNAGMSIETDTKVGLETVKTQVGLNSIKDELSSVFKDPESRTAIISAVGIGMLAYIFKSDEDNREVVEDDEEIQEEVKDMENKGLAENEPKAAQPKEGAEKLEPKIENADKYYEAYLESLKAGYPNIDVESQFKNKNDEFKKIFEKVLEEEKSFDPYDIKAWEEQFRNLYEKGLLEKDELLAIYPFALNIDVATDFQLIAIQLKAAMNKRNTGELKDMGINFPKGAKKLSAISMFREGIGSYDSFKKTLIAKLQPEAEQKNAVNNVAAILERCALGKYQILPKHHFKRLGWPTKGEAGLRKMHEYLKSPNMQVELNLAILRSMKETYGGIPEAMAAAYYAGPEAGKGMFSYQKALRANVDINSPEWLTRKQTFGFGSIMYYASKVGEYYKKETGGKTVVKTEEDLKAYQRAIEKKETGFLKGKKAAAKTASIESN
ncbi:lytic transglycosylase domain-containing protein [Candidatus Peregrinibacteria bacterium]|nr:lytic transglycosylase domain-containing protein [Candidatus Peregrinibacteria bacterium]